ncbi:MAG: arsenosugar biosynthesis radical SAM protein ArsS [bacterium]|nr:arsenosugar biosynthesis radical SAM protein ArsS [bacterium]
MVLKNLLERHDLDWPLRGRLETLQVNTGSLCNMTCRHCHVKGNPASKEVMNQKTAESVIQFLFRHRVKTLDITGGAPEMAPSFQELVTKAGDLVDEIIVRCNLTIIFEEGMEFLPDFYARSGIHLVCSLPCYTKENVDAQRGEGTFQKSMDALKILNTKGYGIDSSLKLTLVYNPGGAFLPGNREALEADYKKALSSIGITFNDLITITNMPVNRFDDGLTREDKADNYMSLLAENFNPGTLGKVMCKNLVSVGWDGRLYDCDFNQALDIPIKDKSGMPFSIDDLDPASLIGGEIHCADHCLGCLAGEGSSCYG